MRKIVLAIALVGGVVALSAPAAACMYDQVVSTPTPMTTVLQTPAPSPAPSGG